MTTCQGRLGPKWGVVSRALGVVRYLKGYFHGYAKRAEESLGNCSRQNYAKIAIQELRAVQSAQPGGPAHSQPHAQGLLWMRHEQDQNVDLSELEEVRAANADESGDLRGA